MSAKLQKHAVAALVVTALLAGIAPLAQSVGTVDAVQVVTGGFVTDARVAPGAAVGQPVSVTVAVRSDTNRRALVDLEIYDRSGRKVFQKVWDSQAFSGGRTRQLTASWSTSRLAVGTYTVKVGVFRAGWASLVHWNNSAATVTLAAAVPPTTTPPTTAPPTTAPPTTAPPTTAPPTTTVPPTTVPPATTTIPPTTVASTPATTAPPTTAPSTSGRFTTLPVGAALPTGAQCAARVRPATEVRAVNQSYNNTRGTRPNTEFPRVDGDFTGTTDQILQWVACKWGIDEDIVRAQIAKESWWTMTTVGDNGESFGLGQVRVPYHGTAFVDDNAKRSSAYNLDYTYAVWRSCFEGELTWLNTVERGATYAAGDAKGCLGVWFSGRWRTSAAITYIADVDAYLAQRIWETPNFING